MNFTKFVGNVLIVCILVILIAMMTGCGVIHNHNYPMIEHCKYRCYKEALSHIDTQNAIDVELKKALSDIDYRDMMCTLRDHRLRLEISSCNIKCAMEEL